MFYSKKAKLALLFCIFSAVCDFLFCIETTSGNIALTIDDAVEYALKGNLKIKQSDIALETARRSKSYSWNSMSPSIKATGSLNKPFPSRSSNKGPDSGDPVFDDPATISVGANISINLSPSIVTTIKTAALNYEMQKIDYDTTIRSIDMQVRNAFYAILYQQENIALQESNVKNALSQYNANLAKYNRGLLPRLDVLNSQIYYQNAKLTLSNAQANLGNDMATFKQLLGLSQKSNVTLYGSLDDMLAVGDVSIDGMNVKSSSVSLLEKQVEIAKAKLSAARLGAYSPQFNFGYQYSASTSTRDTDVWERGGSITLGVSIPLDGYLPWSSGAQSIANQKSNLESLRIQLEDQKNTVEIQIENYMNKIRQLEETIELRKQSIDYAKETYNLTAEAYASGTKDILALQSARNSLLSAEVQLKSDAYNLAVAILNLENAMGLDYDTFFR